jgi:hypothetical protein
MVFAYCCVLLTYIAIQSSQCTVEFQLLVLVKERIQNVLFGALVKHHSLLYIFLYAAVVFSERWFVTIICFCGVWLNVFSQPYQFPWLLYCHSLYL